MIATPEHFARLKQQLPAITTTRTQDVIRRVLAWSIDHMSRSAVELHNTDIREIFGNIHDRKKSTARHLFALLFTRDPDSKYVNPLFKAGKAACYRYFPNLEGYLLLKASLNAKRWLSPAEIKPEVEQFYEVANNTLYLHLKRKHFRELSSGGWKYQREAESKRIYHPLQNLSKQLRSQWWLDNGYLYEFDIQAALPTIFYQHGIAQGLELNALGDFVANRAAWRAGLAELLAVDLQDVKEALTAVINGCTLSYFRECALCNILGERAAKQFITQDRVIALFNDAKAVRQTLPTDSFYFEEERKITDIARELCKREGIEFFSMHDGANVKRWSQELTDELMTTVEAMTGWKIKLDWSHIVIVDNIETKRQKLDKWLKQTFEAIVGEDWDTGEKL